MQALGEPMNGLRHAALVLHAMEPADRAWVLERLDPARGQALRPLLEELSAIAFPRDAALVQQALAPTEQKTTTVSPTVEPVCRLLSKESIRTRSVIVSLLDASSRQAILDAREHRVDFDRNLLASLTSADTTAAPALRRAVQAALTQLTSPTHASAVES